MRFIALLLCAILSSISLPVAAAEFGTKDEAVAMVRRVQEMFKTDGADATFKAVSDPSTKEFHDRDLYPFIYSTGTGTLCRSRRPTRVNWQESPWP